MHGRPCTPSQELQGQKAELLAKVQFLKKDLQDWRAKLDTQVHAYKAVRGMHAHASMLAAAGEGLACWHAH